MKIVRAVKNDFEKIREFYDRVTDETPDMQMYARWKKGQHPKSSDIYKYIDMNAVYLLCDNGNIIGAMALTMSQTEDYRTAEWKINSEDDEVSVIHLLGIDPSRQKNGLGKKMIDEAIKISREEKKLACRLDALKTNIPARKMYESKGFEYIGKQRWYAENTGWTDFCLYEYIL